MSVPFSRIISSSANRNRRLEIQVRTWAAGREPEVTVMMQCSELGNGGGGGLDSWRTVSEVSFTGWEFTEMMGHQSAIYRTITLYKPQAPEPAQQPELESSAEEEEEEEEQEEEEDGDQNE